MVYSTSLGRTKENRPQKPCKPSHNGSDIVTRKTVIEKCRNIAPARQNLMLHSEFDAQVHSLIPSILHSPHPHPLSLLQHLSFYAMPALTETIDQGRTRFISPIQLLTTVCLDFEPTSELDAILHFVCVGGKHASGAASKIDCREKKSR